MCQQPSDIAIIAQLGVIFLVIFLVSGLFILKIVYAINKNVWKCNDFDDPFSGFFLIILFAFVPGSLPLHYVYRKIKKVLKNRHSRFNEIEDTYRWLSEHP